MMSYAYAYESGKGIVPECNTGSIIAQHTENGKVIPADYENPCDFDYFSIIK